ncbi:HD domain-containing protein [Phenylobacterium sp.]|uniref:HD domain-containing protein n=1 Tax=Phenylobacterium sp. TaxID=1871053 RepID=UPI002732AD5B|nr:HD domain-containing protein [Phenylobacterium sp.]MDP3853119.1 HD domain-containing protein [Phenylobacterium sp.]
MADDASSAKFHAMTEGTLEDWQAIGRAGAPYRNELPDRLLAHLKMLEADSGGFAVTRLEHSLQTATRAFKDGRDEEYVVCALMHDIGDILGPSNHAEIGAIIMKPYVSERNFWMMDKHGVFQGYYFFHYLGLDRDMRDQYRGHPDFEHTAQFCHMYDQNSFDPAYQSMPLEAFEPMLRRVVAAPKRSIYRREEAAA